MLGGHVRTRIQVRIQIILVDVVMKKPSKKEYLRMQFFSIGAFGRTNIALHHYNSLPCARGNKLKKKLRTQVLIVYKNVAAEHFQRVRHDLREVDHIPVFLQIGRFRSR